MSDRVRPKPGPQPRRRAAGEGGAAPAGTATRPRGRGGLSRPPLRRRLEGRLRTGPAAHLLGGALDFAGALAHYLLARARGRTLR